MWYLFLCRNSHQHLDRVLSLRTDWVNGFSEYSTFCIYIYICLSIVWFHRFKIFYWKILHNTKNLCSFPDFKTNIPIQDIISQDWCELCAFLGCFWRSLCTFCTQSTKSVSVSLMPSVSLRPYFLSFYLTSLQALQSNINLIICSFPKYFHI